MTKKLQEKYGNIEKQGENKHTDKVEPKFKVGDWVLNDVCYPLQIASIKDGMYVFTEGDAMSVSFVDEHLHLWSIQDAEDGDVLVCESGWTCIFKTLVNDETFSSYCFMDKTKWFCETGSECHTLKEEFVKAYNGKIYPATKSQRDLLFQKMKEAGYEWDAQKKELKKIESKKLDMTREELIKEVAVEKFGNDTCRAAEYFMDGMEYAFDYALQEAKTVVLEHFGIDDKYADEVGDLFNKLEERLGK